LSLTTESHLAPGKLLRNLLDDAIVMIMSKHSLPLLFFKQFQSLSQHNFSDFFVYSHTGHNACKTAKGREILYKREGPACIKNWVGDQREDY
jgi:hypothetical protein